MSVFLFAFLRIMQFCAGDEMHENRFFEQATKAGKDEVLRKMRVEDPHEYLKLFQAFNPSTSFSSSLLVNLFCSRKQ